MIRVRIRLSILLGEKRWTQAKLARKTGIRPNTICDLYNEMTEHVNLVQIGKICEALDCGLEDLLRLESIDYVPPKEEK